jgi:hypothetical protein
VLSASDQVHSNLIRPPCHCGPDGKIVATDNLFPMLGVSNTLNAFGTQGRKLRRRVRIYTERNAQFLKLENARKAVGDLFDLLNPTKASLRARCCSQFLTVSLRQKTS